MNKERYVEKMTDLVEDKLLEMGVSPYFTIEDGWEENEELSMRLYHDVNGHEISFDLADLYAQKKEEDIKIRTQFNNNILQSVVLFVERENALNLDTRSYSDDDYDDDYDDEEEDYEDDLDDEEVTRAEYEDELDDEYDDDEDEEEDYDEDDEYDDDDYDDEDDEYEDDEEEEEEEVDFSSKVSNLLTPLKFKEVSNSNGAVMMATLPSNFNGDLEKVSKRYQKQMSELPYSGYFVTKPNKQDVLVFDADTFDKEEVESIVKDLYEKGGELEVKDASERKNEELFR